jgi:hypothetical protein
MDGAEKLLSISQCQTTVVYSLTVLSALGRKHSSVMVACVFFFDFTYKTSNSLEPIPNFNHVCSGKDPDHADSKPDPRSVIDEKKRLILLVMLMLALHNISLGAEVSWCRFVDYLPLLGHFSHIFLNLPG